MAHTEKGVGAPAAMTGPGTRHHQVMKNTKGIILNISRSCTDDGPGIRTTVFLKGCPLSCIWCHNPESQKRSPEVLYNEDACLLCGACASVCPGGCHEIVPEEGTPAGRRHIFRPAHCSGCGKCTDVCVLALKLYGQTVTVGKILPELLADSIFFETSGGGVTVSGGEPLSQPEFTAELMRECHAAGVSTCMETSGAGTKAALEMILPHCDLVLFDVKETDPEKHLLATGQPLEKVLSSLYRTDSAGVPVILRLPVVPGINDRREHFQAVRQLAASLKNCRGIQIMPYHTLGVYKYRQLQRPYPLTDTREPSASEKDAWNSWLKPPIRLAASDRQDHD